jgi:hypothetical protein
VKTIWKYGFEIEEHFSIDMPEKAEVLSIQLQDGIPFMWVRVDPENETRPKEFTIVGTGHPAPPTLKHLGTIQTHRYSQTFVWHIFEGQ